MLIKIILVTQVIFGIAGIISLVRFFTLKKIRTSVCKTCAQTLFVVENNLCISCTFKNKKNNSSEYSLAAQLQKKIQARKLNGRILLMAFLVLAGCTLAIVAIGVVK